jgi:cation diffusion facilitator family transporter
MTLSLTSTLVKLFVKNKENINDPKTRASYGTLSSIVGIILNVFLSIAKLTIGTLFGSIAITADATNNLSDAGSQIVSFISFKISAKPADRDHPFGHARIEYVASMIVSFLILHIGFDLLSESVKKIFSPEPVEFSPVIIVVLSLSILCKLWLALFNRKIAKKINSSVIRATAADSLSDAIATSAVLVSVIVSYFTGFDTDAYMGIAVSMLIFVAGIKILNDTKNSILGSAPEPEVIEGICEIVGRYPDILGIHDMTVHNYGPGNTIASLHAEVDGSKDVFYTHDVIDNAENDIYAEMGVRTTIHLDPIVTNDELVNELRRKVTELVKGVDERLSIHDFRFVPGHTHSNLLFDVCAPFEVKMTDTELKDAVSNAVSNIDPNYFAVIMIDRA